MDIEGHISGTRSSEAWRIVKTLNVNDKILPKKIFSARRKMKLNLLTQVRNVWGC